MGEGGYVAMLDDHELPAGPDEALVMVAMTESSLADRWRHERMPAICRDGWPMWWLIFEVGFDDGYGCSRTEL